MYIILSKRIHLVTCIMNAQECRILTVTHMHDSCTTHAHVDLAIAYLRTCVYLLNIRSIELATYYCIHTLHLRYSCFLQSQCMI